MLVFTECRSCLRFENAMETVLDNRCDSCLAKACWDLAFILGQLDCLLNLKEKTRYLVSHHLSLLLQWFQN